MHEEIVGLYIGDHRITAAEVVPHRRKGTFKVRRCGWIDTTPDADDADTVERIRQLWRIFGFRVSTVSMAMRSTASIVKYFRYPFLSEDELRSALLIEAEESLLVPQGDIVVDWHVTTCQGVGGAEAGGVLEGVLVAAPRHEVEREVALLRSAYLYPLIMDVPGIPAANLFLKVEGWRDEDQAVCLLHVTRTHANVIILFGNNALYPRRITASKSSWCECIDELTECVDEELRYFEFKLHKPQVDRLVLIGDTDARKEILAALAGRFSVPLSEWDPLEKMRVQRSAKTGRWQESGRLGAALAPALGLALRTT